MINSIFKIKLLILNLLVIGISVNVNAGIIGEDDRIFLYEVESSHLKSEGAKIFPFNACNQSGTGFITRSHDHKNDLLVISAHFHTDKNGSIKIFSKKINNNREKVSCTIDEIINDSIMLTYFFDDNSKEFKKRGHVNPIAGPPINDLEKARNWAKTGHDYLIFPLKKKLSNDISPFNKKRRGFIKFLKSERYDQVLELNAYSTGYHKDRKLIPSVMKKQFRILPSHNSIFNDHGDAVYVNDFLRTDTDFTKVYSGSPFFIRSNDEFLTFAIAQIELKDIVIEDGSDRNLNRVFTTKKMVNENNLLTGCDINNNHEGGVNPSNIAKTFKENTEDRRKLIQIILKERYFYTSTIDGLWGKNTQSAIELYAKERCFEELLKTSKGIKELLNKMVNEKLN